MPSLFLTRLRHMTLCGLVAALVLLGPALPAFAQNPQPDKNPAANKQPVIMGWIEYVYIQELNTRMKAKLDTGATTSSMRGEILKVVEPEQKDGKTAIVFQVEDENGKVTTLQRNLVRWVRIKGKSGTSQRRPVIEMAFCVAGRPVKAEVNLAPRQDFIYPILVGRNMLRAAGIIVDSSRSFTARAQCPDLRGEDETEIR